MPMAPGARLGPFEIVSAVPVSGRDELYRARDDDQHRDVALRVVRADFGASPDRLRRFQQAAAAAALLSHPNVLAVLDVGTDERAAYIVSEPLEGRTLRQVLSGGALPVRTVTQYAVQVAHALAAAHEGGVVHGALTPDEIWIGPEGRVRVAGFGLTAAHRQEDLVEGSAGPGADMLAFGEVVAEMLGGAPRADVPPVLTRLVKLCLSTRPGARPAAADAAALLHHLFHAAAAGPPLDGRSLAAEPAPRPPVTAGPAPRPPFFTAELARRLHLVPILAGAGILAAAIAIGPTIIGGVQGIWSSTTPAPLATAMMPDRPINEFALAPDGQRLAFTAVNGDGQRQLWVRSLTGDGERVLTGTEGAAFPFWSPDSRFIAYFAGGALRKIGADGSMPSVITDADGASPGAWNTDDLILFGRDSAGGPLYSVSAQGGTPVPVTGLRQGERAHAWPAFLADGRFLYTIVPAGEGEPGIYLGSVDSLDRQPVIPDAASLAVADGYVVYLRDHALTVQPFDIEMLTPRGDPIRVGEGAPSQPGADGVRSFSVSAAGLLAYQVGPPLEAGQSRLVWVDRAGREIAAIGEPAGYGDLALSPSAALVAVRVRAPGSDAADIAVIDVATGARTAITSDPADDRAPLWSPDSRRLIYASARKGSFDIYQRPAAGTGADVVVLDGPDDQIGSDWTPDGRYLLYQSDQAGSQGGNFDLWARPLPAGSAFPFYRTVREATLAKMAPNGQWAAYVSFEDGREEVFVVRFPRPDGRRRVSAAGGSWPRWRRDGAELFYVAADGRLMAVPMNEGTEAGEPAPLFRLRADAAGYPYDVAPDGQRILVNAPGTGSLARPITLIDWRASAQR